jgi:hypothetical protein
MTKPKRHKPKYNQRGCSLKQKGGMCLGCCENSSFGPILGIGQNGGCGTCGGMKGGSFYKPAAPLPAPLVGNPWGPKVFEWPGVDGIPHDRNYFTNNLYKQDPQTMMKLGGSTRRQKKSYRKRGKGSRKNNQSRKKIIKGGAIFQDIRNLSGDLAFNFEGMYNRLYGYKAPVNPAPYADQFSKTIKSPY